MEGRSFEQLLKEVNEIARRLESGELPLEEAIREFERGSKILKEAKKILAQAKQKLEILTKEGELQEVDPEGFLKGEEED